MRGAQALVDTGQRADTEAETENTAERQKKKRDKRDTQMCVRARVFASPSDRVRLLVLPYGGNFRSTFRLGLDHVSNPGPAGEKKKKS